ncbi:CdaR family protein [Leeuwenhoekiella sp. W20_SRS_FM14]|uniref:CdaR family protein n=1 Tax=Leeuwenhoekiella sp. W20_SRS_FM14 TaxID=3240270 RepID=UPI003F97AB06
MSDKKKRSKNSNLRVFVTIFLVVAAISIMIKLNRNFSFTVKIPLTFQNLSEDYILKKSSTTSVKVTGKASGYDYFKYRFFSQAFPIDLSNLPKDGSRSYYVFTAESDALKGSLSGSEITEFEPDTVYFTLDRNYDKRVPVISNFEISYAPGYGSFQGMEIKPDSITVRGPESEVDTITKVYTSAEVFEDIRASKEGNVSLHLFKKIPNVELLPNTIAYNLHVDKFTEGSVSVPLQLINVPPNVSAKVFPKRINVIFNVNVTNYDRVKSSDFKVVVDFDEADSLSTSLTPQVIEIPEFVRDVRISESTVQYLLVK